MYLVFYLNTSFSVFDPTLPVGKATYMHLIVSWSAIPVHHMSWHYMTQSILMNVCAAVSFQIRLFVLSKIFAILARQKRLLHRRRQKVTNAFSVCVHVGDTQWCTNS